VAGGKVINNLRAGDLRKAWSLAQEMTEANSLNSLMEILLERGPSLIPFESFYYVRLSGEEAPFPERITYHNTSFGDDLWRDYIEEEYWKQDPMAVIYVEPGMKNVPIRVNRISNFYESAVYRDLLNRYGVHTPMSMRMEFLSRASVVGVVQMRGARAYTKTDESMMALLAPHLTRNFAYCELVEASPRDNASAAVMAVARGAGLTRRETEILSLVKQGLSNMQLAARLYLSDKTVKTHMTRILRKTGARNRVELLAAMLAPHERPV